MVRRRTLVHLFLALLLYHVALAFLYPFSTWPHLILGHSLWQPPCPPHDFGSFRTFPEAFQDYVRFHGCATGRSDVGYVLLDATDGLGNRLLSISSGLLYAMMSSRVLLVHWNHEEHSLTAGLSTLFDNPGFAWESPANEELYARGFLYFVWSLWRNRRISGKEMSFTFDDAMVCTGLQEDIREVVWIRTSYYFAPLLLQNPHFVAHTRRYFGDDFRYFEHVFPLLFNPARKVRESVSELEGSLRQQLGNSSTCVGLHWRSFGGMRTKERSKELFVRALRARLTELGEEQGTQGTQPPKPIVFLSDDASSLAFLRANLWNATYHPGRSVESLPRAPLLQLSRKVVHREDASQIIRALSELLVLGKVCDEFIVTGGSTFSMVIHGHRGTEATVVTAGLVGATTTSEPCYDFPPTNSSCGVEITPRLRQTRCKGCCTSG